MLKSIQHFKENSIKNLETIFETFLSNPQNIASLMSSVEEEILSLGLCFVSEFFESLDEMLRDSGKRRQQWYIVKQDEKEYLTSLGSLRFKKTLFKNKTTGKSEYLLDQILGLRPYERMTEDAKVNILQEAVLSSYQKAGEECSLKGGGTFRLKGN